MRKKTEAKKSEAKGSLENILKSFNPEALFKVALRDIVTHSSISTALQNVMGASVRFREGNRSLCLAHLRIAKEECEDAIKAIRRIIYEEKKRMFRASRKRIHQPEKSTLRVVKKKTQVEI